MGSIAAGGVIRDHNGYWLEGFIANLGTGQILDAELLGILYGLKIAWDDGYREVIVESDSTIAVGLINQSVEDLSKSHSELPGAVESGLVKLLHLLLDPIRNLLG